MNNSRLFRLAGLLLRSLPPRHDDKYVTQQMTEAATQYTQQVNQNYAKSLPFSDRQDFDDAQRGFIAPLLDEGILRDEQVKLPARMITNLILMPLRRKP